MVRETCRCWNKAGLIHIGSVLSLLLIKNEPVARLIHLCFSEFWNWWKMFLLSLGLRTDFAPPMHQNHAITDNTASSFALNFSLVCHDIIIIAHYSQLYHRNLGHIFSISLNEHSLLFAPQVAILLGFIARNSYPAMCFPPTPIRSHHKA